MSEDQAVIFFDGVCNLCNGFVQFVIARDKAGYYKFASLQSATAETYLKSCNYPTGELNSVVLYENGKCYTQSTAALRILKKLSGAWPVVFAFIIIPEKLRNLVYDLIAKNRYRWFGKQESCWLPTPELKGRFL